MTVVKRRNIERETPVKTRTEGEEKQRAQQLDPHCFIVY